MKNILVNYKGEILIYLIIFVLALFLSTHYKTISSNPDTDYSSNLSTRLFKD